MNEKAAFPSDDDYGMSLYDYFAATALKGLLANPDRCMHSWEAYAKQAYEMAFAMYAERARNR